MATGLDRIIEQILADAEAKAAEQVAAAEEEAKKTLADAAAEAEQKANVLLADSEKVGADIKARAASTAEFTRRRTVLAAKQNAIRDVIAAAQKELHDLPDDEYFSVLLKLAQKNALPGDAEMQLNEKDLARMPQDFSGAAENGCARDEHHRIEHAVQYPGRFPARLRRHRRELHVRFAV